MYFGHGPRIEQCKNGKACFRKSILILIGLNPLERRGQQAIYSYKKHIMDGEDYAMCISSYQKMVSWNTRMNVLSQCQPS